MTTLRQELKSFVGDDLSLIEHYTLGVLSNEGYKWGERITLQGTNLDEQTETLDKSYDPGYGSNEGPSVLLYTKEEIIFSVCYDGAEWLA